MGPVGGVLGGLAGAVVGALVGGSIGGSAGARLGEIIDENILKKFYCFSCESSFSRSDADFVDAALFEQ
jgi:phage tail tape-measure protein